jgi:hypothetical protein
MWSGEQAVTSQLAQLRMCVLGGLIFHLLRSLVQLHTAHSELDHVQMRLLARLCLLLETMHRHKRTHGNLSPHHIIADTSDVPFSFTLVDMSCSRHMQGSGRCLPLLLALPSPLCLCLPCMLPAWMHSHPCREGDVVLCADVAVAPCCCCSVRIRLLKGSATRSGSSHQQRWGVARQSKVRHVRQYLLRHAQVSTDGESVVQRKASSAGARLMCGLRRPKRSELPSLKRVPPGVRQQTCGHWASFSTRLPQAGHTGRATARWTS